MEKVVKKTDMWSIFVYLILYSIAGFVIETTFGIFTKGVIESRKSFLYGPFCCIYGIGAIAMILFLKNEKSYIKLFVGGAFIGASVEYLMSLMCEKYFGVKWWDYTGMLLSINGRTCLFFAVSWGILAIFLMKIVNPYVDKFIYNLRQNKMLFQLLTVCVIIFFSIDAIISAYALRVFYYRIATESNLNVSNIDKLQENYAKIKNENNFLGFIDSYYNNDKILKNYPNMMIEENDKNQVYIENLINGEKYYYKLGDLSFSKIN